MLSKYFNFNNASIVKDDFISFEEPLKNQVNFLYEDMFHVAQENLNIIFDIGWYGDADNLDGKFILHLIKNEDWDNPMVKLSTKDLSTLKFYIKTTIDYISTL